ncbi:MAG TPA: DUF3558 family protein [Pseudonocardiaceae bacterium]|nr:DUF3558 family protein [Pseudonocardiaceae bacterium]
MTHRKLALVLPLMAVAAIGLNACSSQNSGNPVAGGSTTTSAPTTSASSDPTSSADPLASVDPCSLITQTDESNSQLQPGQTVPAAGGRGCRWNRPDDGATLDGYTIQIVIYPTAGIDQLNTQGGTVTDTSVGKYKGKLFQDTPTSYCDISLATSSSSRIDMAVNSSQGMAKSCSLVQEVAPVVVGHFPAGS